MISKWILTLFVMSTAVSSLFAVEIKTGVQPWAVPSISSLDKPIAGNFKIADGITETSLQFWNFDSLGTVFLSREFGSKVSYDVVDQYRQWGEKNDVKIVMELFNGWSGKWHWETVQYVLKHNRTNLVKSICAELDRTALSEVRIDFEAEGSASQFYPDSADFNLFISELADSVHAKKRFLQVSTNAGTGWSAPNVSWWPHWAGKVDGIVSMSYTWVTDFAGQQKTVESAGYSGDQITFCFPGDTGSWSGKTNEEYLNECFNLETHVSVLVWDIRFVHSSWRTESMWTILSDQKKKIRGTSSLTERSARKSDPVSLAVTSEGITIDLKSGNSAEVKLFTLSGKQLVSQTVSEKFGTLPTGAFASGIYLITITGDQFSFTKEIMIP